MKKKPTQKFYFSKTFTSMKDMLYAVMDVHPTFAKIFKESPIAIVEEDDAGIQETITKVVLDYMINNPPSLANPKWPFTDMVIVRSSSLVFHTKNGEAFCYQFDIEKMNNGEFSVLCEITYVIPTNPYAMNSMENTLRPKLQEQNWREFVLRNREKVFLDEEDNVVAETVQTEPDTVQL